MCISVKTCNIVAIKIFTITRRRRKRKEIDNFEILCYRWIQRIILSDNINCNKKVVGEVDGFKIYYEYDLSYILKLSITIY